MPISDLLILTLGSAIAKSLVKVWLKDPNVASDFTSDLIDLIGAKTNDVLLQKRANRQFESIGEKIAKELLPLFENERELLDKGSQEAVALAVASTLGNSKVDSDLLVSQNLDAKNLSIILVESSTNSTVGFSFQEKELFERVIFESSKRIVDVASSLPSFSERTFSEILKREDLLLDIANNILLEVRETRKSTIRYFISLDEYLSAPGLRFPKLADFQNGLVYIPENYIATIREILKAFDCCMLMGRSAAGKTVLSISIGKMLLESSNISVYYLDATKVQQGDGRRWFQSIQTQNNRTQENTSALYIIDNCHKAVDEVAEFYFQWSNNKVMNSQILFVSRPEAETQYSEFEDEFYSALAEVTIKVESEKIYWGLINKYANFYVEQDPALYTPIEFDNQTVLESQHSHNLVISRSRIEAWRELGGKLSQVEPDKVYFQLAKRYIKFNNRTFLTLCALWQFEILAHNLFVDTMLEQDKLQSLLNEHILQRVLVRGYGFVYQLNLHPEEAKEVLVALYYSKYGEINIERLKHMTLEYLKDYLLSAPVNFVTVYDSCYKYGYKDFEKDLILDVEIQGAVASNLINGRVSDVAKYLFNLVKLDRPKSMQLFEDYVETIKIEKLCDKLTELSLHEAQFSLNYFQRVNHNLTLYILQTLGIDALARTAEKDNLNNISWALRTLSRFSADIAKIFVDYLTIDTLEQKVNGNDYVAFFALINHLERISYPKNSIKKLINALDIKTALKNSYKDSFNISYFVKKLRKYLPKKSQLIVDHILDEFIANPPYINWYFTVSMISFLRNAIGKDELKKVIGSIDISQVSASINQSKYYQSSKFIHRLSNISPFLFEKIVSEITAESFILILREGDFKISTYLLITKMVKKYKVSNLRKLQGLITQDDILTLLKRTKLNEIGDFFFSSYDEQVETYEKFSDKLLREKISICLDESMVKDIVRFIIQIDKIPSIGSELAINIIDTMMYDVEMFRRLINRLDVNEFQSLRLVEQQFRRDDQLLALAVQFNPDLAFSSLVASREVDKLAAIIQNDSLGDFIAQITARNLSKFLGSLDKLDHNLSELFLSRLAAIQYFNRVPYKLPEIVHFLLVVSSVLPDAEVLRQFTADLIKKSKEQYYEEQDLIVAAGILVVLESNSSDFEVKLDTNKLTLMIDIIQMVWRIIEANQAIVLAIIILGLKNIIKEKDQLLVEDLPWWEVGSVLSKFLDNTSVDDENIVFREKVQDALVWVQEILLFDTFKRIDKLSNFISRPHVNRP